jgi:anti-sigma B factor antagonist
MVEVNVSQRQLPGGVVALDLRGFVDKRTVHKLDESIGRLLEQGRIKIIVNCAELGYISSVGIGTFLSYLIKVRKAGGDIKFCSMSREAQTILTVIGSGNLFELCESEAAALKSFERREREREARERAQAEEAKERKLVVDFRALDAEVCVLRLVGIVDRHESPQLESAIQRALTEGRSKIVVNCDGLKYIDSRGVGIFIAYLSKARAKGGDIRFCHMRDIARTWISILGLQNMVNVHETEAQAIASYRGAA